MKKFILSLLTILVMSSLIACNAKNEIQSNNEKAVKFKKIYAAKDEVVALTEDGDLYSVVEKKSHKYLNIGNKKTLETFKVASNIKDFLNSNSTTILDNNNNLYYTNTKLTTKLKEDSSDYKLICNDVKDYFSFCSIYNVILKNNNTTEVDIEDYDVYDMGINTNVEKDIRKLSDVKYVILDTAYYGYVNNKGELFIKTKYSEKFKKILEGINKYKPTYCLFLTDNNELYYLSDMCNLIKIDDDVVELNDEYYKTQNGDIFIPNYPDHYIVTAFPKNSPLKEDLDAHKYSIKLEAKNVDTVVSSWFDISSVTYTTTDGMLVRNCKGKEQKVKLTIDNLTKLYEFENQNWKDYENR